MKGSDFLKTLGAAPTAHREEAIIEAVVAGHALPIHWWAIRSEIPGHSCTLYVASDALLLGEEDDYVRVNVTHVGAQRLADALGYALPTTKISDMIYTQAAFQITPCTQTPDAEMGYTHRMLEHSEAVTHKIAGRTGLVSTVGKDWVLTNRLAAKPLKAANYGWHVRAGQFRGPAGLPVLQPLATAHECHHVDYSQVYRPIHRQMVLDGQAALLEDVLTNVYLAPLLSDEGVLVITRHPGVPLVGSGDPAPMICG